MIARKFMTLDEYYAVPQTKRRMYVATCINVALILVVNRVELAARSLAADRGPHLVEAFSNESGLQRIPPVIFLDREVTPGSTGSRAVKTLGKGENQTQF